MTEFVHRIKETIVERRLFSSGQGIVVAVSGGLDSMVLLEVLNRLALKHRWRLAMAHFNHRLRGRSSDADEALVARTARNLKLRFVRGEADVRRHAEERKISVEMAARELRHAFLARTALRLRIRTVALAHHADDQVELFFLRLLRGAASEGLAGMKWRGVSPADRRVALVRPLLALPKEDLAAFATEQRIAFREDATNAQLDYRRNRIRHELLPLLKKNYQPALTRVILRQMEILADENEVVAREADWVVRELRERARNAAKISNFKFQISNRRGVGRKSVSGAADDAFESLPVAVQRRCLQTQLMGQGIAAEFELIEKLRARAGVEVTIGPTTVVLRDANGRVHTQHAGVQQRFNSQQKKLRLSPKSSLRNARSEGTLVFDNVELRWRILPGGDGTVRARNKPGVCEQFDADKVGSGVTLRHWQAGDRFQPIGMPSAVKLQDLFINGKVPHDVRRQLIVAATLGGEIFWVEGLRIGERFKLEKNARRRLQWSWKRLT